MKSMSQKNRNVSRSSSVKASDHHNAKLSRNTQNSVGKIAKPKRNVVQMKLKTNERNPDIPSSQIINVSDKNNSSNIQIRNWHSNSDNKDDRYPHKNIQVPIAKSSHLLTQSNIKLFSNIPKSNEKTFQKYKKIANECIYLGKGNKKLFWKLFEYSPAEYKLNIRNQFQKAFRQYFSANDPINELFLKQKGKGKALKNCFFQTKEDYLEYMSGDNVNGNEKDGGGGGGMYIANRIQNTNCKKCMKDQNDNGCCNDCNELIKNYAQMRVDAKEFTFQDEYMKPLLNEIMYKDDCDEAKALEKLKERYQDYPHFQKTQEKHQRSMDLKKK